VALPFLEAMLPQSTLGAAAAVKSPVRTAFFYVPNGVVIPNWTPTQEGTSFELPSTLKQLEPFRDRLLVLSGLTADKARPHGDGPGDHARAMAAFLTGAQPRKTSGANIKVGKSVDQIIAEKIGKATRFSSMELGIEGGKQAGNCDSGYSCAYSSSISWRTESSPLAKEINPRLVFDRLFGGGKDAASQERTSRRSILDFVAEDARGLKARLGGADVRKLDEYLTGVREIETRLARVEKEEQIQVPAGVKVPDAGIPKTFREHMELMADVFVLALQADLTRVATFVLANEGSNRAYKEIGVTDGHHQISHHGNDPEKLAKLSKINRLHMEGFAYLLKKLDAVKENGVSLLDNCMLVYGSGNSDGNRHNHDNLPILLLGKGGGTIRSGRHIRYQRETPLTNLYLSMLDRVGASVPSFGDSTGRLPRLDG
jgi:Protein of unknown function (DUF1552)